MSRIMGVFHTNAVFKNIKDESKSVEVNGMLVDTGAESSWVPRHLLEIIGVQRRKKDRADTARF